MLKRFFNSEDKKRLFSNFLSLSVLQAANYVLPLLTLPYLVRVLGPEKFGLIAFSQAFIQYFVILTDYGFNLSATRDIAINRENREKVSEIFSTVMIIKFTLLFISAIILTVIVFSFEKFRNDWEIYYLTFGIVVGQVLFPVWFFQGMERMKYITFLNILAKIIFTVAIFIFIRKTSDYIYVPLINSLGFIVAGVLSLWIVFKDFGINSFSIKLENIIFHFRHSTKFFLSRVAVSIYTISNTFVLGLFTNNTIVGYYSMAEKLYQALQNLYFPLTQTIYPYIANTRNSQLFKRIFKFITLGNTILVIFLMLVANVLFNLLFSVQVNSESITVFRIFLTAALVVVPSILMGYPFLAAMGYPEYANKSVIYGSILHFVGLGILATFGFINAYLVAFMVVVTETFVFLYRVYFSKELGLWTKKVEK